jgi:hypothetical protein
MPIDWTHSDVVTIRIVLPSLKETVLAEKFDKAPTPGELVSPEKGESGVWLEEHPIRGPLCSTAAVKSSDCVVQRSTLLIIPSYLERKRVAIPRRA